MASLLATAAVARCGLVGPELDPGGGHRWSAGVLVDVGESQHKVFMVPLHGSDRVLCFDPVRGTAEPVGPSFSGPDKWRGAVLGPDNMVYGVPWSSSRFLGVDPLRPERSGLVGPDLGGGGGGGGDGGGGGAANFEFKWSGGVLASDGVIYCAPFNSPRVLAFDPIARAAELVGPAFPAGGGKWSGAVLGPDGRTVFCVPYNSDRVLAFDTAARSAELLGGGRGGGGGGDGVAELGAGSSTTATPQPTTTSTTSSTAAATTMTSPLEGRYKYMGGVLARDGLVYCLPFRAKRALAIDTARRSVALVGPSLPEGLPEAFEIRRRCGGEGKFGCPALGADGRVYGVPFDSEVAVAFCPEGRIYRALLPLSSGVTTAPAPVAAAVATRAAPAPAAAATSMTAVKVEPPPPPFTTGAARGDETSKDETLPVEVEEAEEAPLILRGRGKWSGGVASADGTTIYGVPCSGSHVLAIFPPLTASGTL
jgi:hypothetical protein